MGRQRLFILGPYRTGTSILWKFMKDLGYELLFESNYMGFNQVGKRQFEEPDVYKEDKFWKRDLEKEVRSDTTIFGYDSSPDMNVDLDFLLSDKDKKEKIIELENRFFGDRKYVGEKSVNTIPFLSERFEMFSDAYYLFTIRDPMHICYSCLEAKDDVYWSVNNPNKAVDNVVYLCDKMKDFLEYYNDSISGEILWLEEWTGNRDNNINKLKGVPNIGQKKLDSLDYSIIDDYSRNKGYLVTGSLDYKYEDSILNDLTRKKKDKLQRCREYWDYI